MHVYQSSRESTIKYQIGIRIFLRKKNILNIKFPQKNLKLFHVRSISEIFHITKSMRTEVIFFEVQVLWILLTMEYFVE